MGQEWQDTIPEMVSQHPCYRQMKPRHPGLTSSLTYGEAQACFNKWMWYTMKLLGKWYKRQAEQTKNELRGDFDLSRRENPGKTMMPILHWLCVDPTKLIIKASLSAPT